MALTEEGIINIPGVSSRWVRLGSGIRAHYVTAGESGPNIVLLHGGIIGSSGTAGWRFMAPYLADNGFRVYCPDMPSFGLTVDHESFYEPGPVGHLDFIHDFTTALGLDRFHIGGNSMGCVNSVNYVVAHPERVISYALIAGFIGDLAPMDELTKLDTRPSSEKPRIDLFDGTEQSMRAMMEAIIYRPVAISDDLIKMRTLAANKQREAYARHWAANSDETENTKARLSTKGRLDRLTTPGIYLYGKDDVLLPVVLAYPQEDALPSVQFFYPDECGHQGQTDQPEMFNQVFLEFFRDGKVSRKTAEWAGVSRRRPEIPQLVEA
jgi:2-hydroxy-6-oxonona-2,4-dienedioate hydrolase